MAASIIESKRNVSRRVERERNEKLPPTLSWPPSWLLLLRWNEGRL